MTALSYGLEIALDGVSIEDAIARVRDALRSEGFGIVTEIDVKKTLKEELNQEFRRYHILGTCNPRLAHQALLAEPQIGLLLPYNIVVQETDSSNVRISIADPGAVLLLIENPALEPVVEEAFDRMERVLDSLKA